jgi:hypothetical protein
VLQTDNRHISDKEITGTENFKEKKCEEESFTKGD